MADTYLLVCRTCKRGLFLGKLAYTGTSEVPAYELIPHSMAMRRDDALFAAGVEKFFLFHRNHALVVVHGEALDYFPEAAEGFEIDGFDELAGMPAMEIDAAADVEYWRRSEPPSPGQSGG